MVRRQGNKIEALVDDNGSWVEGKVELMNMDIKYTDLFSAYPNVGGDFIQGRLPPLEEGEKLLLQANCTMEEVIRALNGMGSLKAPWPNGYQFIFFKKI